jgi:CheY-like chemotaxis protein
MHASASSPAPEKRKAPLIFVVDDDPGLLELTALILRSEGYELQAFCNPHEALQAIEALHQSDAPPDLLLTDYEMGTMTGIELIRRSRELFPHIHAVIVSGTVEPSAILNHRVRVTAFITKPYKPRDLIARVQSILAGGAGTGVS